MTKTKLLEEDDDNSSVEEEKLIVNQKYAKAYEERKQKEDFTKSRNVEEEDEDEDLSPDDEVAEELTEDLDKTVNETIRMIRDRDPRIYDPNFQPFANIQPGKKSEKKEEKQLRYKDMIRERALQGQIIDEEEQVEYDKNNETKPSYFEDQEKAKKEFTKAIEKDEEDDEDDDFLKVKATPTELPPPTKKKSSSSKVSQSDDDFLWNYVNERVWLKDTDGESSKPLNNAFPPQKLLEEDEEEIEKAEEFEEAFNYRFQEHGATNVTTHARKIDSSLRRKDDNPRKKERLRKQERKEEEKKQKLEELKRLKNLKRKMIEEQVRGAFSKAGNGVSLNNFNMEDLEGDFDPKSWDEKMAKIFNDEYYAEEDEELKVRGEDEDKTTEHTNEDEPELEEAEDDVVEAKREELIRKLVEEKVEEEFADKEVDIQEEGKFRYRQVAPNDYGLDEIEILEATNKELNEFVSLKRLAPYAEKEWFASAKHRKRFREKLKQREKDRRQTPSQKVIKKSQFLQAKRRKVTSSEKPSSSSSSSSSKLSSSRLKSFGR